MYVNGFGFSDTLRKVNGNDVRAMNDTPRWMETRWGAVAKSVIHDLELSSGAKVVFCELTLWARRGDPVVCRGQRAIAAAVGMHQETALNHLRELAVRGHIQIEGAGRERRKYRLMSAVYRKQDRQRKVA